jgi:nucleoside-triphosphatase
MPENDHHPVFILTGRTGGGKTTFLIQMIEILKGAGLSISGFAAVSVPRNETSRSYDLLDVGSGKMLSLASGTAAGDWERSGRFYFNPEGIRAGKRIFKDTQLRKVDLMVVDEIGPFELEGRIWADELFHMLPAPPCSMLLVVRESLIQQVVGHWHLEDVVIIDIRQTEPDQAADMVMSETGKK